MTLQSNVSIKEVFDEFERIEKATRIIGRPELARDTAQFPTKELAVYPPKGYVNNQSEIKVPLNLLQKSEPNLKKENIKKGVSIFGEVGTMSEVEEKLTPRMYVCERDKAYRELDINTRTVLNSVTIDSNNSWDIWCNSANGKTALIYTYGHNIYKYDDQLSNNTYVADDTSRHMKDSNIFSYVDSQKRDRVFRVSGGNLLEYNTSNYTIISSKPSKVDIITATTHNDRFRMFAFINSSNLAEINEHDHSVIRSVNIDRVGDIAVYSNESNKLILAVFKNNHTMQYFDADTLTIINTVKINSDYVSMSVGFSKELIYKGEVFKLK
ncbi:MAG: hypothetical protein E6649_17015 [Paeniclostridium sordellii]|nr:hypothetical protein [Paeniclostridium sordellii]